MATDFLTARKSRASHEQRTGRLRRHRLGYWGPNLVRNFATGESSRVIGVADLSAANLAKCGRLHPDVVATHDARDLLQDPRVDAIAVATPVHTHYELALAALRAGKHVLVEKPFTETSDQALRLIDEADRRGLTLMVDHTFLYTPAVQKIRQLITENAIGDVYYYNSTRASLGLFQSDVNVIWDLAVHDLSIIQYILDEAAGRGLRHRRLPRRRHAGEHGARHPVLSEQLRRPYQCQLAVAGEGAQHPDRRKPQDDRI